MGPNLFGDLTLLTNGYLITFVFKLLTTCQQLIIQIVRTLS